MKFISITKGLVTSVSSEDFDDVLQFKWSASSSVNKKRNTQKFYAVREITMRKKKKRCYLHRYIMEKLIGRKLKTDEIVDHIDGNSLNNCRENLRVVDAHENNKPFYKLNEERKRKAAA